MKIRNGFVSNSSSSSFVVCFDKEIKTAEDLLPYCQDMVDEYYWSDNKESAPIITKETFVNHIFPFRKLETDEDIMSALRLGDSFNKKISLDEIISAKYGLIKLQKTFEECWNHDKSEIIESFDTFINSKKGNFWYVFSIDDHGENSSIEYMCESFFINDDIVKKRISHH